MWNSCMCRWSRCLRIGGRRQLCGHLWYPQGRLLPVVQRVAAAKHIWERHFLCVAGELSGIFLFGSVCLSVYLSVWQHACLLVSLLIFLYFLTVKYVYPSVSQSALTQRWRCKKNWADISFSFDTNIKWVSLKPNTPIPR